MSTGTEQLQMFTADQSLEHEALEEKFRSFSSTTFVKCNNFLQFSRGVLYILKDKLKISRDLIIVVLFFF